jgi:hypothetical protein
MPSRLPLPNPDFVFDDVGWFGHLILGNNILKFRKWKTK